MGVSQQSDPQVVDLSEPSSNSTETSSRETTVRFKDVDSSSPSVLFVDDEPDVLKACCLLFEAFGFSILTADSEEKALDLLQTDETDAVVLNYVLPGIDGDQLASRIREARGKIPIILLGCSSLRQMLLEIVNASVNKLSGAKALLEALEQNYGLTRKRSSQANTQTF